MASEKTSPMAVNVLNYDADPTGAKDSTAAIQKAINDVAARGGGSVEIPGGIYRVTYPFIELKHRVEVFGHGQATRIIATGEKTVEFTTGVFHTGTYSVPMTNPNKGENKPMRMGVRDLFIRTNPSNLSLSDPNGSFWKELHTTPLMPKVVGVLFHTEMPDKSSNEPDAVPLLSNVEIWGTDIGVAILGKDDQGMKVHNLRIRKALRQGLLVGKPVGHPLRKSKDQNADGADNKFSMIDVSGTNQSGGVYAGIEVYASQTKFELSSSWYNHRTLPKSTIYSPENAHAGAGWLNRGERNMYIGCTAQENGGHGWVLRLGKSQFIGCLGESSSFQGASVGGQAQPMEAANWYIMNGATGLRLVAPRSHNPKDDRNASLYGLYIEGGTNDLQIIGGSVIDERMSESNLKNRRVCVTGRPGNQVILQIDKLRYQKFTPDSLTELPGGTWVY